MNAGDIQLCSRLPRVLLMAGWDTQENRIVEERLKTLDKMSEPIFQFTRSFLIFLEMHNIGVLN